MSNAVVKQGMNLWRKFPQVTLLYVPLLDLHCQKLSPNLIDKGLQALRQKNSYNRILIVTGITSQSLRR